MPKVTSKKNNGKGIEPTFLQRRVFEHLVANRGKTTYAAALRASGASQSTIRNPDRVIKTKGFSSLLEKAGVSDSAVSKKYKFLMDSSFLERESFDAWRKGKKWFYPTDEQIKEMIEGTPDAPTGCKVVYIRTNTSHRTKTATFRHPDNVVQKGMVELIGKVRSHFAPDKLDIVTDELSDEDLAFLLTLNGKDNK